MGIGAIIGGIGALGGSLINSGASKAASQAQVQAQMAALNMQQGMFNTDQANLSPFIQQGQYAQGLLNSQLPALTAQFNPSNLQNTPGYQFTLGQGLQAAQNGFAAQGLGSSGAAIKGGTSYATGLAQSTYNQQLQNYLLQNQQTYNMLAGQQGVGVNAAAGLGQLGNGITQQSSNSLTNLGNAQASGTLGSANAISSGLTGAGNSLAQYNMLNQLQGNGSLFSNLAGNNTSLANLPNNVNIGAFGGNSVFG